MVQRMCERERERGSPPFIDVNKAAIGELQFDNRIFFLFIEPAFRRAGHTYRRIFKKLQNTSHILMVDTILNTHNFSTFTHAIGNSKEKCFAPDTNRVGSYRDFG